ncbi:MAG: Asp-tRNA(Asn)/Glu-tRNA(Gln) amidotransferase subunit GatB [Chloroflexi bacterium]|nr:Asp-tRNA(Asn)/Glu-tRNA(Gln) amidotransferase subunit GatB [Chloroflexota bacterium]
MAARANGGYRVVIGLEVHAQLLTESKMFCACSAKYADAPPNTVVCPICLGMPGVLPVINEQAVEMTILTGLALNCRIPAHAKFDRKNYAYPDLMKWYQISQYDLPFCVGGHLDVTVDGIDRRLGITRVHLEEDTARMIHGRDEAGEDYSLLDVNRSGAPLMEIVSEPDMKTAAEAREYLMSLRNILVYLDVSTANMQEGAFRCDANISVWPRDGEIGNSKVEVKNMNSFRSVYRALEFEEKRQIAVWESGNGPPEQETRGWHEASGTTVSQRTKEYAHDYRYFAEPDLPPLVLDEAWVGEIAARMPELPSALEHRLIEQVGIRPDDARQLINNRELLRYFEEAAASYGDPQRVANWITRDLVKALGDAGASPSESPVGPGDLIELLKLEDSNRVSGKMARDIFRTMFETGRSAAEIVAQQGEQITDQDEIRQAVVKAIQENPKAVADFQAGKKQAAGFLVGRVMRATRGRANPARVNELIAAELG